MHTASRRGRAACSIPFRVARPIAQVITMVIALVVGSAILAASSAWAQASGITQRFVRFGPADGLPAEINALAVDRSGVLWAATGDGLMRYDGTELKLLRRARGLQGGLPDNDLISLAIDGDDRIWVSSRGALSVMDARRRGLAHVRFEGDAADCDDDILALAAAPDGALWLSGYGSVVCRIGRDGATRRIDLAGGDAMRGDPVALLARGADDVLVGTTLGLYRLRDGRLRELALSRIKHARVFHLKPDDDGAVWVGTDLGAFRVSARDEVAAAPWPLPARATNAVVSPRGDGGYWIGTALGLFSASSPTHAAVQVRPPLHEDGLSSGIFDQVRDHEGGWWFASYIQGLSYLPPDHGRFDAVEAIGGEAMSRIDPVAIAPDGHGGFWLAASRALHAIPADGVAPRRVADADVLGLTWLNAVTRCPDGRVWVAGFDKADIDRVLQVDPGTGAVLRGHRARVESAASPQMLFCADDGELWVSLYGGGIRVLDRDARVVRELPAADVFGGEVQDYAVIFQGPGGQPWFADHRALYRWHAGRFEPVVPVSDSDGEAIHAIAFVAPETWWIARYGALERHVWREGRLLRQAVFDQDDGLPGVDVGSLLVAGEQVWLATTRGLLQYDTRRRRARLHGMRDGLPGLDFSLASMARDGRHAMAMAKEGLVRFDPARAMPAMRRSVLAIDAVELRRDEDVVSFAVPRAPGQDGVQRVTMAPGDRDLRIVARVMSFADPALHRYRFRLHGFDPGWVTQDARGERVFSSLSPGTYRLDVQGANADGAWSPTRRIDVVVQAPWWRRGWAFALYVLALVGMVAWGVRLDRRRVRRRHAYQLARQKQALAEDASLAKSRFLANLGHEVRTPMTGVLGMSELLLGTSLDERQRGHVRSIHRAGEHLLRLVNDALDLARAEAGRLELMPVDFDLHALLDEAAALMHPLAERKRLRFVVERDADVARGWHGDATRLRQIVLNLLGNAIKFTEHGEIVLRLAALSPRGVRIEVIDTGPGLDAEQQRRLFRRFEQAEGARTASRYGGSGLGLAICQELAIAMGGGIELRSAPGEGACFIVRLPLQEVALRASPADLRGEDACAPCVVLLVEDDAIVADALAGLLQAQGHRVVHVGHALAALTAIATEAFDIALIDLDLPGMDGLALARLLRTQGFDRPMIAITARADGNAEPQAVAAGFDAFLRKPLTGEMLGEALAMHAQQPA